MYTQAREAGPGLHRRESPPGPVEAAGPASPRLALCALTSLVTTDRVEVTAVLHSGSLRFRGTAAGRPSHNRRWQLAAAATVAAMQQYLQQCATDPSTPQLQLADTASITTGLGQEIIAARVKLLRGSSALELIGSALVRDDRSSTAVAAALDAANRPLEQFRLSPSRSPVEQTPSEGDEPPVEAWADDGQGDRQEAPEPSQSQREDAPEPSAAVAAASDPRARPGFPALGMYISPSAIQVSAVAEDGRLLAEVRRATRNGVTPEATLTRAAQAAREAASHLDHRTGRPAPMGIAVPGQVRSEDGVCVSSGEFPTWRNVHVVEHFGGQFGAAVALLSATHAAAHGELRFGAARGLSRVLYVRVGIDIDAAVIADGKPVGLADTARGQVGHMVIDADGPRCACGELGCWQAVAGREALVGRAIKSLRNGSPSALAAANDRYGAVTPSLIARAAAGGDMVARRALEETGRYLAIGLANLIALFGPEAVVLDSAPREMAGPLLQAAEPTLKSSPRAGLLSRCVLLTSELDESAAVVGAAAWAAENAS